MSLFTSGYTGAEIDEGIRRTYEVFSNRNLLHNWDFRNPVNQRGEMSYANTAVSGYSIDGWIVEHATLSVISDGIRLVNTSASKFNLRQLIENPLMYSGLQVTFSVKIKTNGGILGIGIRPDSGATYIDTTATGIVSVTTTLPVITTSLYVFIIPRTVGGTFEIESAKLELGSVSTLANDPPADFGEQLALCKRFYRLWTTDAARTEALKEVGLMRTAAPTTGTVVIGAVTYYYASSDL